MANTSVFTGADAAITLAAPQGTEGEKAQGILGAYDLTTVGRAQNVKVNVFSAVKPFHEIGQRYATELRPGNVTIRGTIGRAYINGAMLKLLLGDAADNRPAGSWAQPAFNITLLVESPSSPGVRSTVTLYEAKFENWAYTIPEDDFVLEEVSFQALYITTADEQG